MSETTPVVRADETTTQETTPEIPPVPAEKPSSDKPARSPRPCTFFAQGNCRYGSECRFSHDPRAVARLHSQVPLPPPPPSHMIVQIPPGHQVFSIDVECVATGIQHNARSVAQVALVDEWCRPIYNAYIKQEQPVVSYLTPLTGITKEVLEEHGLPLGTSCDNVHYNFIWLSSFFLLS